MAIGTTSDLTVTALELITDALVAARVIKQGDTPGSQRQTDCMRTLNLMIKNMMGGTNPSMPGLKVWQRIEATLEPPSAAISYTVKTASGDLTITTGIPVDILRMNSKDSNGNETPMSKMTREKAFEVSNKTLNEGIPTEWYYEYQRDYGVIHFNTNIDSEYVNYTFPMLCLMPLRDVDAVTENVDFPQQHYEPLKYELAKRFETMFEKEASRAVERLASETMERAEGFYEELPQEDDYFQPEKC